MLQCAYYRPSCIVTYTISPRAKIIKTMNSISRPEPRLSNSHHAGVPATSHHFTLAVHPSSHSRHTSIPSSDVRKPPAIDLPIASFATAAGLPGSLAMTSLWAWSCGVSEIWNSLTMPPSLSANSTRHESSQAICLQAIVAVMICPGIRAWKCSAMGCPERCGSVRESGWLWPAHHSVLSVCLCLEALSDLS